MIKFTGTNERGEPVVGLGLSRANCEQLLAGQPIRIALDELVPGLAAEVLLFAGETEEAIYREFRAAGLIGPDVRVNTMHPDDPHAE